MKKITNVTVRYAETDQMGIVHHSVYPIWYEVARTEFTKELGLTYSQLEAMGVCTPLVELSCRYCRPARYEDELLVETWVSALSPARVEFSYRVFHKGEDQPLNWGKTVHAWTSAESLRPINMKKLQPDLYAKMEQFRKEEVEPQPDI